MTTGSEPVKDTPARMKLYTRTGDKGTSSLYNGERRSKDDFVFHALGDVDELNSAIGVAREHVRTLDSHISTQLETIQSRLLDVGSAVATPPRSPKKSDFKLLRVQFDATAVTDLEHWIDELDAHLPPLANFILPSGGHASASLHLARAICRRAERSLVPIGNNLELTNSPVPIYLNRLSDYLFAAARRAAQLAGSTEVVYIKA